jgi:hypothetical protein
MKEIHLKLTRYSTAVGALLAVSANASAVILSGNFNPGRPDLDNILNDDNDTVYIDMNHDGVPEFYAVMNSGGPFSSRSAWVGALDSSGFVENDSSNSEPFLKKFNLNELVGPSFSYPYSWGYIFGRSIGAPGSPAKLGAPFNSTDQGYIGVGLHSGSGNQYGWIQMSVNSNPASVEFFASASESLYDDPIPAGSGPAVPLLPIASAAGIGLVGLMAAMKRRKKNNTI